MNYRKLFPTNQTDDCLDFCDPSCPYNCYPYADIYFSPPPPPPPLPPLSAAGQTQHLRPYVIIIISLLASFFLLVSYYAIIVKYCSRWNRFRPPSTQSDVPDEEFLDENRGPAIDHPIWYIATVGLQPSIINSITVFRYKKGNDPLIEGTECSVCLSEFQEDETLRLLPKCNHAFHIHCIDTWLRSHTNCPLCRAGIVSNAVSNTPLDSNEHHSRTLISPYEDTEMENSGTNGELGNNLAGNTEICENRARTEDEVELQEIDDSKEVLNSNGVSDIRVFIDSGNNETIMDDEIQTVRRSISMNSVNQREDFQNLDLGIIWKREDDNSSMNRFMGSSSISQSLHKSPVSMKRSFSHGGRLSFLPRHSRNTSSILPL